MHLHLMGSLWKIRPAKFKWSWVLDKISKEHFMFAVTIHNLCIQSISGFFTWANLANGGKQIWLAKLLFMQLHLQLQKEIVTIMEGYYYLFL